MTTSAATPDTDDTLRTRDRGREDIVSVDRAFSIVERLADALEGMSLSEIARHLDVNKAIATKLLHTLESRGFVFRDAPTGRYHLTYKISNLGLRQLSQSRLLDQSSAVLRQLADATGELVRLGVVEGDTITWVLAVSGQKRSLQIDPNYSLSIGLHTHATGKAWLSTMPFEHALQLILREGLDPLTRYSKTSIDEIRMELREAAERGYAASHEENELGVGAIASPILAPTLGGQHECVGTISLAAPTNRMTRQDLEACHPLVIATARKLAAIWPLDRPVRHSDFRSS